MSCRQRIEKLSNRMNKAKQSESEWCHDAQSARGYESGIKKQHSHHDFKMIGKGLVRGHNGDDTPWLLLVRRMTAGIQHSSLAPESCWLCYFLFSMVYVGNNFSSSSWSCCSAGGPCVQNYNGVSCIKTESSSANRPLCPQYQTHLVHDSADTGMISGHLMWMLYVLQ